MSIVKLADAFEAQFFQSVKGLEEDKSEEQDFGRKNSMTSFMHDESRFFENMTIHKQYKEYTQIKKQTFDLVKDINRWSNYFLIGGIVYALALFSMLFGNNIKKKTFAGWLSVIICGES